MTNLFAFQHNHAAGRRGAVVACPCPVGRPRRLHALAFISLATLFVLRLVPERHATVGGEGGGLGNSTLAHDAITAASFFTLPPGNTEPNGMGANRPGPADCIQTHTRSHTRARRSHTHTHTRALGVVA